MNDSFDNAATDREMAARLLGDGVRMNQTRQDARERVLDAKMGSLANASDDFLMAMESELFTWLSEIQTELHSRIERAEEAEEAALEARFADEVERYEADDAEQWERNQVDMDMSLERAADDSINESYDPNDFGGEG